MCILLHHWAIELTRDSKNISEGKHHVGKSGSGSSLYLSSFYRRHGVERASKRIKYASSASISSSHCPPKLRALPYAGVGHTAKLYCRRANCYFHLERRVVAHRHEPRSHFGCYYRWLTIRDRACFLILHIEQEARKCLSSVNALSDQSSY